MFNLTEIPNQSENFIGSISNILVHKDNIYFLAGSLLPENGVLMKFELETKRFTSVTDKGFIMAPIGIILD